MLKERERERKSNPKKYLISFKTHYTLFIKFHSMLHITIILGNNNCVLVCFAVTFTNFSLLETQILGKKSTFVYLQIKANKSTKFSC